jgi:hypothetical protein
VGVVVSNALGLGDKQKYYVIQFSRDDHTQHSRELTPAERVLVSDVRYTTADNDRYYIDIVPQAVQASPVGIASRGLEVLLLDESGDRLASELLRDREPTIGEGVVKKLLINDRQIFLVAWGRRLWQLTVNHGT